MVGEGPAIVYNTKDTCVHVRQYTSNMNKSHFCTAVLSALSLGLSHDDGSIESYLFSVQCVLYMCMHVCMYTYNTMFMYIYLIYTRTGGTVSSN